MNWKYPPWLPWALWSCWKSVINRVSRRFVNKIWDDPQFYVQRKKNCARIYDDTSNVRRGKYDGVKGLVMVFALNVGRRFCPQKIWYILTFISTPTELISFDHFDRLFGNRSSEYGICITRSLSFSTAVTVRVIPFAEERKENGVFYGVSWYPAERYNVAGECERYVAGKKNLETRHALIHANDKRIFV